MLIFILSINLSIGQDKYVNDFFSSNCNICKDSIFLDAKSENSFFWHKAHESLTKSDYQKAYSFLLKDKVTNSNLKKLFLGHVFMGLNLDKEAEQQFRELLFTENELFKVVSLKSLGDFYEKKNFDSVLKYYGKILNEIKLPLKLKNEVYENIAYINLQKKEYEKSQIYYLSLLKSYKKDKQLFPLSRVYSAVGNLYFEQYKDKIAKQYFDSAYVLSKKQKNLKFKSHVVYNLYIVSEALKEHKEAVQYLKEYNVLKDSIQTENTIWKIAQQKEAFNLEKKQVEIDQKTKQRNVFVVFSLVILLLLLAIFWFYKKLQLKHQQIGVLNKELKETNALKNQIFSIVAHDLRSPVALLKQKFQLQTVNEEDETITIDKNVVSVIDSLSFLLDNLLNWSLSQSNLLHVQKDWFPLLPVVKQIEHQYKSLLADKEIVFKIENLHSVLIFGDMELFKIVVRNCLDNAIKFTPKGGEISIAGFAENEFFNVTIKDSGVGIPENILKSLFELNTKKAQKDTQGRKSSGLGLHLVKSMITLNDGKIQIANHPKGGTIVNISIPHKMIA